MSEIMDLGPDDVAVVDADLELTHTLIKTECASCGHPAEFRIPKDHTDPEVRFEPPCGHISAHPNPHANPPVVDEAPDDGTEHVGMTDAGSAVDASGG